jgi:DNA mismatch repair protein MutS
MEIDAATRRNLELVRTMNGAREGSFLSVIDRTVTGAGGPAAGARLSAPLTDAAAIRARHDAVAWFVGIASYTCNDVRDRLRAAPDMERALTRLTIGRGGPRDLGADPRRAVGRRRSARNAACRPRICLPISAAAAAGLGAHHVLIDRLARAMAMTSCR